MAEIALKGNMKVKTLKADFKKAFGSSLRVYMSPTCKGRMADERTESGWQHAGWQLREEDRRDVRHRSPGGQRR